MKTALLIGSGGREHALAWRLSISPQVSRLIVVPGGDGMSPEWERWSMPLKSHTDFEAIALRAKEEGVDLAVIGPDNPLADGIVDVFEEHGILTFGPRGAAARIEASKSFAKEVMQAAGVPTARFHVTETFDEALALLRRLDWAPGGGWVLKADGLALGKGVCVCSTLAEAEEALGGLQEIARSAGISSRLVIEEKLSGEEISWLALCDGERCALLEPARDFKRVGDRDQGPNTGGMGAFSPVPGVSASMAERVRREVFLPTLKEMKRRGASFKGVLYAGLMVDFARDRYWVLEFNSRFGDPETQVLMARWDGDFYAWCEAVARENLATMPAQVPFVRETAVVVIAAAKGYPERPEKGAKIEGFAPESGKGLPSFFCAGAVKDASGAYTVSGGRVLGAMGMGATQEQARAQAYQNLNRLGFSGMHYRKDIAAQKNSEVIR